MRRRLAYCPELHKLNCIHNYPRKAATRRCVAPGCEAARVAHAQPLACVRRRWKRPANAAVLRVAQLDAGRLDVELASMLQEQLRRAFSLFRPVRNAPPLPPALCALPMGCCRGRALTRCPNHCRNASACWSRSSSCC